MLKDVITCDGAIINNFHTIKSRNVDSRENFIFSITKFDSGFTYNVFPDDAIILGTIRTYKQEVLDFVKAKLQHIARTTAETYDCKVEFELNDKYPPTVNHPTETAHVVRIAEKYIGAEHVKTEGLPMTAAEDFSYYLKERPGCFYMLGTRRPGENYVLHTSHFNYNDSMIATGAYMFLRIVEDRLGCKFFKD
jgi:metal-dependent amidase/aminoacylase/carboxypeptidase family protein